MKELTLNQASRAERLAECGALQPLPADALDSLARAARIRQFEPGEMLLLQDTPAEGFYALLEGKVKVHRLGPEGRNQVIGVLSAGELLGEVPVFQGTGYPASAEAIGPVAAAWVPGETFLELAEAHPDMLLEMLAVLAQRLRRMVGLIEQLSLMEVPARLAKHLLDLRSRTRADRVRLETSKRMLAGRLGTSAETLSRTLRKLQQRKMIDVSGPYVTVRDVEGLLAVAAGERC